MSNTPRYHHQSRPASRFALKNRSTGDWLSSANYSTLVGSTMDIYGDQQEEDEVQNNKKKISGGGTEGAWYKHEENRNYRDPIRSRLPSADGRKIKEQHENSFSRITPNNIHQVFIRSGVMRDQVTQNSNKIRGNHETPLWFIHPENAPPEADHLEDTDATMAKTRLTTDEAFYYRDRNKLGCHQIFGENNEEEEEDDEEISLAESNWRPETRTGLHPRAESELWFHHEEFVPQQNGYQASKRYSSKTVRETVEKSQGMEMLKILHQVPGIGEPLRGIMARKKSFQVQSTNSTMQYVLDQRSNENYKESFRCPRAVKPEGMETFKKNKDGSMGQCLSGYPDKPHKKEIHKISMLDEDLMRKHKGINMAKAMVGELPPTGRNVAPRAIKPEAESNAVRNQGSMKNIFTGDDDAQPERVQGGSRLRTKEAREIARRYHYGSMKDLLF